MPTRRSGRRSRGRACTLDSSARGGRATTDRVDFAVGPPRVVVGRVDAHSRHDERGPGLAAVLEHEPGAFDVGAERVFEVDEISPQPGQVQDVREVIGQITEVTSGKVDRAQRHPGGRELLASRRRAGRCWCRDRGERLLGADGRVREPAMPHTSFSPARWSASAVPIVPVAPVTRMRSPEITGTGVCRSRSGRAAGPGRDRSRRRCSGARRAGPAGGRRSTVARPAARHRRT